MWANRFNLHRFFFLFWMASLFCTLFFISLYHWLATWQYMNICQCSINEKVELSSIYKFLRKQKKKYNQNRVIFLKWVNRAKMTHDHTLHEYENIEIWMFQSRINRLDSRQHWRICTWTDLIVSIVSIICCTSIRSDASCSRSEINFLYSNE